MILKTPQATKLHERVTVEGGISSCLRPLISFKSDSFHLLCRRLLNPTATLVVLINASVAGAGAGDEQLGKGL